MKICTSCGVPRPANGDHWNAKRCRDDRHKGTLEVTPDQLKDLGLAAKAYNSAKDVEGRAAALNEWCSVLAGSSVTEPFEQGDLFARAEA